VRPPGPGFGGPPFVVELRTKLRKAEEALANVNKDYDMFRQDSRNQFNMVTEQLEAMRTSLSESKYVASNIQ
jgi:DNA anti-recombination protein RmuC